MHTSRVVFGKYQIETVFFLREIPGDLRPNFIIYSNLIILCSKLFLGALSLETKNEVKGTQLSCPPF